MTPPLTLPSLIMSMSKCTHVIWSYNYSQKPTWDVRDDVRMLETTGKNNTVSLRIQLLRLTHMAKKISGKKHLLSSCPWPGISGSGSTGSDCAGACLSDSPCCLGRCRSDPSSPSAWRSLCSPRSCTLRSVYLQEPFVLYHSSPQEPLLIGIMWSIIQCCRNLTAVRVSYYTQQGDGLHNKQRQALNQKSLTDFKWYKRTAYVLQAQVFPQGNTTVKCQICIIA